MNETIFDAPSPELAEPKDLPTTKDFKNFNKTFVTRLLPTVIKCNHKVDPELPPRANCTYCWLTYFNSNSERMTKWQELLDEGKEEEIKSFYGDKYLKHLKKFLVAVQQELDGKK